MGIYRTYVLPRLIDLVMRNKVDTAQRVQHIPLASGAVLEIGIGSGLNLPFYGPGVKKLYGLDPSVELWKLARRRVRNAPFSVEFLLSSGESIPLKDETVDTVVSTWTLCTIPAAARALAEIRRVLKPGGQFIFIEHGWSPDRRVLAWQNRLNPMWKRLAGGCNLNRKIDDLVVGGGFRITRIETGYSGGGPKPLTFLYRGIADRPAE